MGRTICETVAVTGLSKGKGTGGVYTSTPTSAVRMSFFEVSIGAVEHLPADCVVHRGFEGSHLVLVIGHKSDLAELLMPDGFQPDPVRRHLHFMRCGPSLRSSKTAMTKSRSRNSSASSRSAIRRAAPRTLIESKASCKSPP